MLSIVALDRGVTLDCRGSQRGIFFDGVPAHVDGINFIDGYGEGAGCILSTQAAALAHHSSVITRCTFTGCTGVLSPSISAVAGAVLIFHEHTRVPRTYSVARSTFQNNYARGEVRPAGALGVWVNTGGMREKLSGGLRSLLPQPPCRHFVIDEVDPLPADVGSFGGSYHILDEASATLAKPIYNSIGRMPTAEDGRVTWAINCERTHRYGLVATTGSPEAVLARACDAPVMGGPAMAGAFLGQYEYWVVRGSFHSLLVPQCQDRIIEECAQFLTANVPSAQAGRHGLFTLVPEVTFAERPVFESRDGDDTHYVWYCSNLREWIFSDNNPEGVHPDDECKRGITSVATDVSHPALVDGWKHWNNVTSQWSVAAAKRFGGLQLVCQSPHARCPSYELINAPLDRSATFHELETHHGERPRSNSRGIFASQTASPTQYLSFCAKYSEWMIHEENPYLHPEEAAVCERTFSSTRTQVPAPDMVSNWAIGRGAAWETSSVELVCSAECASVALWASNGPTPCEHCGDYVAHGTRDGSRAFRQVNAPHHLILRSSDTRQWVVAQDHGSSVISAASAILVANDKAGGVNQVTRWSHVQPPADGRQPVYTLSCTAFHNCQSMTFEHADFPKLSGTFYRTARAVNRRASYATPEGATLEFSEEFTAWVIRHPSMSAWLATSITFAMLPTSGCRWDRKIVDGVPKPLLARGQARCVGASATRPDAATLKRGDSVTDSTFTSNMALTDPWDRAVTAGGLLLHLGWATQGSVQRGTIRNVTVTKNEAVSHLPADSADAAGGISIRGSDKTAHFVTISDVTAAHNVGDTGGGLAFEGVSALLSRITTKNNQASVKGGGIAGYDSHINVSAWACAHNHARTVGGCAAMGAGSRLSIKNSELLNGSASAVGGVVDSQGYVSVLASRIERMVGMALTGSVLSLVDSQLYCGVGRAMTYVGGFGCVHDPAPTLPSGTTTPVVPIDSNEAWWIWVANLCSMLAQGMLSLTMAVFAIQYCMAHHLANVMPTARQLQASRWRASQRQLQQQQQEDKRRR
jgi:hypothetical protein